MNLWWLSLVHCSKSLEDYSNGQVAQTQVEGASALEVWLMSDPDSCASECM